MKLEEIESRIVALKARYAELDAKSFKADVWDGVVLSAMTAVDNELKRLNALREKALVADVVELEAEKPAAPSVGSGLPLPGDFAPSPGDEVDPLDGLSAMPSGEAAVDVKDKLFCYMLRRTTDYITAARDTQKKRPVMYTQGQHLAVMAMLAFIQTEYRLLSAFGRDRRNAVEKRLLERIEALEASAADFKYCGTWKSDTLYRTGNFVTDGGSIFHANRASVGERPGTSDSFTLAVKKGKDAKS